MRWLLMMFLLLASLPGFSQDEWYLDKPIQDFRFIGLESVSQDELLPIVRPYLEQAFTLKLFWEVQEKLYALDYFDTVEANAVPADEKRERVIIEFRVKEKPSVSKIVLEGNRKLGRGEILDKILLKQGDMVSQSKVDMDSRAIRDLYLEKGYMDAQVTGRLKPDEGKNTLQVVFEISEGYQTTIKEIRFVGNSFVSESTLRWNMKTKAQGLFSSGILEESKLEEDLRLIQNYYGERGYVDAKVERVERTLERDEEQGRNSLVLTLYIKEGEQWKYGGTQFAGNEIFTNDVLNPLVRQKPGSILNKSRLDNDFQRVADLYYENGYIFNVINRVEERDEKNREIRYTLKILERDRAHIESIRIKGNEKTKDFVILRELPFEEGDIFSKKRVLQGLRNLYNLQYFSAVNPETPQGSAEGLMDLIINVEEGSTANINFGVMFSGGDYPISGVMKWEERNFLGRGQTLGVNLQVSYLKQLVSLSFEEPWLMGKRWQGAISLSLEHAQVTNILQDIKAPIFQGDEDNAVPDPFLGIWVDPDTGEGPYDGDDKITDYEYALLHGESVPSQYLMTYELWSLSLGLQTGYRHSTPVGWLGIRSGLNTSLEFVTYDENLYRPFDPEVRENLGMWSVINKLWFTPYLDGRDYTFNPTQGYYLSQGITFAGGFLLGLRHYIRTDSTAEGFLTLFNLPVTDNWSFKMILAAHSSLSLILPQFGQDEAVTAPTDLLYIDGMNVARGWSTIKERKALWDNRLELRMPIAEQFLWWTWFMDGAAIYYEVEDLHRMNLNDFYFSLGGGLRFTIPQFPIRLYLAQRFRVEDGRWIWEEGALPLFGMNLDFVISLGGDAF